MSVCDEMIFHDNQKTMTPFAAPSQTNIVFELQNKMGFALTPSVCGGRKWDEAGPAGSRKNVSRTAAAGQTEEQRSNRKGASKKKQKSVAGKTSKVAFGGRRARHAAPRVANCKQGQKKLHQKLHQKLYQTLYQTWDSTFLCNFWCIFLKNLCIAIAPLKFTFTTFFYSLVPELSLECNFSSSVQKSCDPIATS